jgi:trimethylamine-N-oxide reductase (cytochrome c)
VNHALGKDEDGIEKTPEWASQLCGVPVYTIKALARQMHQKPTTIAHCNGGSMIRAAFSHEPARMETVLLGMQGLGKPGRNQFRMVEWGHYGKANAIPYPRPEVVPNIGGAYNGTRNFLPDSFIVKTQIQQGINATDQQWWFSTTAASFPLEDQFVEYCFPNDDDSPYIHMIWSDTVCHSTCWNHGNGNCDMFRNPRVDFIMCQHPWFENDMIYSDLLLPVNTVYQTNDINVDVFGGDMVKIYIEEKCVDQTAEEYSDWEIVCKVADRMGLLDQYAESIDEEFFIRRGWERSGVGDRMSFEEFKENEYYIVPTDDNWQDTPYGFAAFCEDPQENPLLTPTGYLEFYSANLAEYFPDDKERRPYPYFIDESPLHQDNLHSERSKVYPFLLVSNHPHWRVHAQLDDVPWFREISPSCKIKGPDDYLYEPIWINPEDAEAYEIQHGDVVKIYNDRGWVLGGAWVTERIMPGVLSQDHGARLDPIEPGVSDRGGANNLICPLATTSKNCAGEVTSSFLVGLEKVDVFELAKQYPEAFSRPYDHEYGLCLETWIRED